jgi:hypothetical protein
MLIDRFVGGVLRAPAGLAGGDGGSGGGGGTLTMDTVLAEVDKRIGAQLTAGFEKFGKESLGSAIDAKIAPITESLSGITEALGKLSGANGGGNGGGGQRNGGGSGGQEIPPELNVQMKALREQTAAQGNMIESLKKQKEESDKRAETSERHSNIKSSLNNLMFTSDQAAKTAFTIVEPFVQRRDDGSLIGGINGDNLPLDNFVKEYLTKEHPYLLRASGTSGSGAPLNVGGSRMGIKADLNDIQVGMTPETRSQVLASIGAALAGVDR